MAGTSRTESAGIKSSEDIREDLECPVCFKIPRTTPIYQCEQGHIHCKTCHPRLQNCPVCRGPIGNTRNLVVEKIISKLPVRCVNFENGCQEPQALPDQIIEHEKYCEFRMVNCFYTRCGDSFVFNDFAEHLKKPKHRMIKVKVGSKMNRNISANKPYEFLMNFKGGRIGVSHVMDDTGCKVMRVFFIGSPITAKKFRCIISFRSIKADNDLEITFKGSISAYQDTLSDIAPCLIIHPKTLQEIVNEENKYKVKITIFSKRNGEPKPPKRKRQRLENESTSAQPAERSMTEHHPTGNNDLSMIESEDDF